MLRVTVPEVVLRSELVETLVEARDYYRARLAMAHRITCYGRIVSVVFEPDATHLYSVGLKGGDPRDLADHERVERRIGPRTIDVRRFDIERARLMDRVLPAISSFTVSTPEAGGRPEYQKRVLYGPALPSGERMRVVLRPGPGDAWTCVSAYPVSVDEWIAACRLRRAKWPP